ncbi:benenodin family lasso peptide [Luteimonas sp. RD2P54]|uniref:Benenodin family lasso peptide n=1 Tax=Luteimonas endophytica TaxID=3042023 RepID=A0ABT6J7Y5_9GAMM|nr:benenodin family lasso peptide [Luteimonas endophytica]MDH5822710.1 benenodin family lasso peptide [Luteimonas endophytica]
MNNSNDNTPRPEMQDDIIELGAASIETKGPLIPPVEGMGAQPTGISAE